MANVHYIHRISKKDAGKIQSAHIEPGTYCIVNDNADIVPIFYSPASAEGVTANKQMRRALEMSEAYTFFSTMLAEVEGAKVERPSYKELAKDNAEFDADWIFGTIDIVLSEGSYTEDPLASIAAKAQQLGMQSRDLLAARAEERIEEVRGGQFEDDEEYEEDDEEEYEEDEEYDEDDFNF